MGAFDGRWRVRRESGLLPPFGVRKTISGERGWTRIAFLPLLPFRVRGLSFVYLLAPIRDELSLGDDGRIHGEGFFLGVRFCRFRMDPA